jgi:sterol-4alpha-carboxylate 3-dehydrogenase (decarboxylating)
VLASILGKTPTLTRKAIIMSCMTRYYNINKAKRALHYQPLWSLKEGIDRGVNWFLEQDKAAAAPVKA